MDAEQLRENGHKMVDFIADYYKSIENFPVLSQVEVMVLLFINSCLNSWVDYWAMQSLRLCSLISHEELFRRPFV